MHEPTPTTAVVDAEPPGNEHIDDEEDTGGVDEEVVAKADERKRGSDSKEEAGEVIEESEKVEAAKQDAANDVEGEGEGEVDGEEVEAEVEERVEEQEKRQQKVEQQEKKRPGRPKKKAADGDVEEEPKAVKRARPRAEKKEVAAAFVADRPSRERKYIDRFTASTEKDKSKELQIKEGGGTPLKDIPNFVYKLSKRSRHDETLSQLHSVLFSKRGKAVVLKQNILQFSGYVWVENEEKERAKIQEKLERYTKESLLQFLDLLDVHVSRTLKKEDLVTKLLEFLEKPHKTTERLLEVKEQIRKGEDKTPSKNRARKNAPEDDGSDGSEKVSDSASPVEEVEQKRLTFKDETDHEEESMVEEKKQASNSSTAVKQDTEENEVEEEEDHEEKEESTPPRKKPKVEAPDATLKTPSKSADRFYSKKKSNEDTANKETSVTASKKRPGRPKKSLENSAKKTPKDKVAMEEDEASSSGEEFLSKKEARSRKRRANRAEAELQGEVGQQELAEDGGAPTSEKKRRKRSLQDGRASVPGKRGVVYLSRIPPHMKPLKMRHLLEPFGEVLRIYLAPEDAATRLRRKRAGGNTGKNFTEGWVEFAHKSDAKRIATMLNGEPMEASKRSAYHYDLWNMKYLKRFKWDNLTEEIAYKNAVREQRLAAEISAAKKERDFFLSKVDQSRAIASMEERKKKKKELESQVSEKPATEKPSGEKPRVARSFNQKRPVADGMAGNVATLSHDVLAGVFGKK